jgi:hypothetical protein
MPGQRWPGERDQIGSRDDLVPAGINKGPRAGASSGLRGTIRATTGRGTGGRGTLVFCHLQDILAIGPMYSTA